MILKSTDIVFISILVTSLIWCILNKRLYFTPIIYKSILFVASPILIIYLLNFVFDLNSISLIILIIEEAIKLYIVRIYPSGDARARAAIASTFGIWELIIVKLGDSFLGLYQWFENNIENNILLFLLVISACLMHYLTVMIYSSRSLKNIYVVFALGIVFHYSFNISRKLVVSGDFGLYWLAIEISVMLTLVAGGIIRHLRDPATSEQ